MRIEIVAIWDPSLGRFIFWMPQSNLAPPVLYFSALVPDWGSAEPFMKLDKNWQMAWRRSEEVILAAIGPVNESEVDVVSDNEDLDEEEQASSQEERVTISNIDNPLQSLEFLKVFADAIKTFLNTEILSKTKVELNNHKISMVLQELLDFGVPFIVENNQLREHIPSDSLINSILATTKQLQNKAASSINNFKQGNGAGGFSQQTGLASNFKQTHPEGSFPITLEKSGSKTPWRTEVIRHNENELFVDLVETINLIVVSKQGNAIFNNYSNYNGTVSSALEYSKATIDGTLDVRSTIPGKPHVTINLDSPLIHSLDSQARELFDQSVTLHQCIDKSLWRNSYFKQLECVPPDGKSQLMKYSVDVVELANIYKINNGIFNLNKYIGLIEVELKSGIYNPTMNESNTKNEFEIIINTGGAIDSTKEIENLEVEIDVPAGHDLKMIRSTNGTLMKSVNNGTWKWKLESPIVLSGSFIMRCVIIPTSNNLELNQQCSNYETLQMSNYTQGNGISNNLTKIDTSSACQILKPNYLNVKYSYKGSLFSGMKVKNVEIFNESDGGKPFKGVKYISKSSNFIVR